MSVICVSGAPAHPLFVFVCALAVPAVSDMHADRLVILVVGMMASGEVGRAGSMTEGEITVTLG